MMSGPAGQSMTTCLSGKAAFSTAINAASAYSGAAFAISVAAFPSTESSHKSMLLASCGHHKYLQQCIARPVSNTLSPLILYHIPSIKHPCS